MRLALGFAAAVLLLAPPAVASNASEPSPSANDIVCKDAGPKPGSLLQNRKICMKRGDWLALAQNDRHEVELFQLRQLQMPIKR
jgi:hypothetical protein